MPDSEYTRKRRVSSGGAPRGARRPDAPTPCPEWDVQALVDHLVTEQLWTPQLLGGKTTEEVGDQLGADPAGAWDAAARAAQEAFGPACSISWCTCRTARSTRPSTARR